MKTPTRARPSGLQIIVHITSQMLELWDGNFLIKVYSVSTAKRGIGNASGSWQTPLGQRRIYKKIGYNLRPGQVIFRQRPYSFVTNIITVKPAIPTIEFITTRVMWLEGLQAGTNRGNGVDFACASYLHPWHEFGVQYWESRFQRVYYDEKRRYY